MARGSVSAMAEVVVEVLTELKQRVLQVQVSQVHRLVLSMLMPMPVPMSMLAPRGSVALASPAIFDVPAIARDVSATKPVVLSSAHLALPS